MSAQDYLIGGLAFALGWAALWNALVGQHRLMQLAKFRVLTDVLGPNGARVAVAVLGAALVVVGVLIMSGFRFSWQKPEKPVERSWQSQSDAPYLAVSPAAASPERVSAT